MSGSPKPEYRLEGTFARRALRLLGHALRTEPWVFGAAIAAAAAFSLLAVYFGTLLGQITDEVVVPGLTGQEIGGWWGRQTQDPVRAVLLAGAVFLAIGLVNAVLVGARRSIQGAGVAGLAARHHTVIADALASLPLGWHRTNSSGRLLSAMSSDSETATNPLHPFAFTVGSFVMMGAAGYAMWQMDPWIALTGLAVIPVIFAINVVYERVITPQWDRGQSLRAEVSSIAHESFEGGTVVKALGAEKREGRRFAAASFALRDADTKVGRTSAWFEPMMDLAVPLGSVALMIVGTHRAAGGFVSVGDVVSSIYLVTLLAIPIRGLGWVLGEMPSALVSFGRVGGIAEAATEVDEPGTRPLARAGAGRLAFEAADVGADDGDGVETTLVRDVSLALEPGTVTALVGPTGSGKSVLALAATRLARPLAGRVTLDGVDLAEISGLEEHVALVPQTTFVFAGSVRDNVTLGGEYTDEKVWDALERAAVADVVRGLGGGSGGLDAVLSERGMNLSGGQRQRLALARALVRDPRVLVLDDATSAVDPRIERDILTGLGSGDNAPTVLIVAYRLASIMLADKVIHLERGRLVDAGLHRELLERDQGYRSLVLAYEEDSRRQEAERRERIE